MMNIINNSVFYKSSYYAFRYEGMVRDSPFLYTPWTKFFGHFKMELIGIPKPSDLSVPRKSFLSGVWNEVSEKVAILCRESLIEEAEEL